MSRHLGRECNPPCHIGCDTCKPKQPSLPACVDCAFIRRPSSEGEYTCAHESCRNFDPVDGHTEMKCRLARRGGPCGLEGKLFKQTANTIDELIRWFLLGGVAVVIFISGLRAVGWM